MDKNMFIIMDILLVGFGAYILYAYYLLKVRGEAKEELLLAKDIKWSKCKDQAGYTAYMAPRMLIIGCCTVISGILGVLNDSLGGFGWAYIVMTAVFVAVIIWFGATIKKSAKMFW